jgi:hypothetical protein
MKGNGSGPRVAFIPVSLYREQPGQVRERLDGAMVVPLPLGEPGDVRRLRLIAAETAARKKKSRPPAGTFFRNAVLQRAFLRYAARQRLMNIYIATVPGPRSRCTWQGLPWSRCSPWCRSWGTFRSASACFPTPGSSTSPWSRTGTSAPTPGLRRGATGFAGRAIPAGFRVFARCPPARLNPNATRRRPARSARQEVCAMAAQRGQRA